MKNKILSVVIIAIALASPVSAFYAVLDSHSVREGGIIKVRIGSKDPAKAADIAFMDRKFPAFFKGYDAKDGQYIYTALVPVPLDTTGKKKLIVRCMSGSGVIQEQEEEITVNERAGEISEVDTGGMLDDDMRDAMHEENGLMREYIDKITPVKYEFPFIMPVKGVISTGFGASRVYDDGEAEWRHKGIDIAAKEGAPVKAINNGTVVVSNLGMAYGNMVIIDHGGGVFSLYLDMQKRSVKKGDSVAKGDIIGAVGSTGLSTGPHLHFQVDLFRIPVTPYGLIDKDAPVPATAVAPAVVSSTARVIY